MNPSLTFKGIIKDYTHKHKDNRKAKQQLKKIQSPAACQSQNPLFSKVLSPVSKFMLLSLKGSLWCSTDCKNLYLIYKDQLPRKPIHLPAFFFLYVYVIFLSPSLQHRILSANGPITIIFNTMEYFFSASHSPLSVLFENNIRLLFYIFIYYKMCNLKS